MRIFLTRGTCIRILRTLHVYATGTKLLQRTFEIGKAEPCREVICT